MPILGLLGETGTLATVLKREKRDGEIYNAFDKDLREDLGDILWYVAIIATRIGMVIESPKNITLTKNKDSFDRLYSLAKKVLELTGAREVIKVKCDNPPLELSKLIIDILSEINNIAVIFSTNIEEVADDNWNKIQGYWKSDHKKPARQFDQELPYYEKIPRKMDIDFVEINDGKGIILRSNEINIGNRLTDNAPSDDGYRYHDVFHLANLATLGWSPVFRGILQCKRKSVPSKDEIQDGARAVIIEEAVINHIYDYARDHNFLEGMERIDLNLIKRVLNLVRNYEVEKCKPWEWQYCIIEGYRVFRKLKENKGGTVRVDSDRRSIEFIE